MTEQQLYIVQLVANHKQYNALKKELEKSSYEPVCIVPKDYILVFDDSLLNIAKLFGKRIEYTVDDMTYDCVVDVDGVTFTAVYSYDLDEDADMIDEIIEYRENYNYYFSLDDNGLFKASLKTRDLRILFATNNKACEERDGWSGRLNTISQVRSFEDYCDEVVAGNNECAILEDSYTDIDGKHYLLWRDNESNEDYITEYKGGNVNEN